ncbi:Osmotically-inducible protein Y precursor [Candidatus Arcanobacter lacustris]|jgi:osmotically-inducible protein OsmY|uniref:Osmotically-inducible protein Y n=1 Tax=Candidatus Arcanibacter lacustris TaxID=1607817 RepID=A0A0F5MMS6_9RICK|nr:Osmotically-inducible protein Y precursor [Candidatus Arcanobacter lacustris]
MLNRIILSLFVLLLTNCAPVILGAATSTTSVIVSQERTAGDAIDDATITVKIKSAFLQRKLSELFASINVITTEGRVLLTGSVPSIELKDEAVAIAWKQKGVKDVFDELEVREKTDGINIKDPAIDSWITTQLETKFLFNKEIKSVNYNIKTINQVVYLTGIAQNQQELDRVTDIVNSLERVKKLVNHVRLKSDSKRDKI